MGVRPAGCQPMPNPVLLLCTYGAAISLLFLAVGETLCLGCSLEICGQGRRWLFTSSPTAPRSSSGPSICRLQLLDSDLDSSYMPLPAKPVKPLGDPTCTAASHGGEHRTVRVARR